MLMSQAQVRADDYYNDPKTPFRYRGTAEGHVPEAMASMKFIASHLSEAEVGAIVQAIKNGDYSFVDGLLGNHD